MIGLKLNPSAPLDLPPLEPPAEPKQPLPQPDSFPAETPSQKDFERSNLSAPRTEVYQPDSRETLDSTSLELGTTADPYPEDKAIVQRESASLRLPPRHFKPAALGRGEIIGVEPATLPQDIAWVSTFLEAAKYQSVRPPSQRLRLSPTDLRRYRRAAVPEQLLMLVLDHTCLRECQWQAALLPYLQWAYVERANVCLVQVGAANATQELQAEKVVAQNILVPRISQGLEMGGGQATPLAHGLDLALQTLRHALQHGRNAVQQAVLVVISDGRGNVPLAASRANEKPTKPVNRQGIEDALQVAQQIGGLKQVGAVVLNPQPKYYADLPVKLAQALGAKIAAIPSLKPWEVDEL
jgi:magnesium chelatase subunit D